MDMKQNRAWAEIDLAALEHNFDVIRAHAQHPILCVVKANAYGHGAVPVAHRLEARGAAAFGVATADEALELRAAGIRAPIVILGYVDLPDLPALIRHDVTVPVYDHETAVLFSETAAAEGRALKVHFALDTGMSRIGFQAAETEATIAELLEISRLPGLESDGAFTHFAAADTGKADDRAFTLHQFELFRAVCDGLEAAGLHLPHKHCANSAGVVEYTESYMDLVRAGIILYGYPPDPSHPTPLDLRPVMTVKTHIVQVRDLPAGRTVGYGRTYRADETIREAVAAIGYADGFLRTASGRAQVVVDGQTVPVIGRVCMDMLMLRLPAGSRAARGDIVTVFGNGPVTADDLAAAAGTISYEVLCAVAHRVPRIYLG
ncbi:MAG: alanine racemase [Clostridiales bacterium]|nr:alanine racemase [Clostridiales bacterium]